MTRRRRTCPRLHAAHAAQARCIRENPAGVPVMRPATDEATTHKRWLEHDRERYVMIAHTVLNELATATSRLAGPASVASWMRSLLAFDTVARGLTTGPTSFSRSFQNKLGTELKATGLFAESFMQQYRDRIAPGQLWFTEVKGKKRRGRMPTPEYEVHIAAGAITDWALERDNAERVAKAFERYARWAARHPRDPMARFEEAMDDKRRNALAALRFEIELKVAKAQSIFSGLLALGHSEAFTNQLTDARVALIDAQDKLSQFCAESGMKRLSEATHLNLYYSFRQPEIVINVLRAGIW